ncbi:MAG TPA: amino acid adenylation domain-containing protein [Pyrinomonadaceae bacterium]
MPESKNKYSTLIDLLRLRCLEEPGRAAYRFLADGETEASRVTCGELDLRARAVGALLQSMSLEGERVLLLYPPGLDFVAAFFGCLYAGAVAVPAPPPRPNRDEGRVRAVAEDAQAACVLTTTQLLSRVGSAAGEAAGWAQPGRRLATDRLDDEWAAAWREPRTGPDAVAYLQYTSGSTSTPKGVMVTHANVLANSAYIGHGFGHGPGSVSLSWLPHFHDMGLLDGVIQPLYGGFPALLMPPAAFLQSPARWLRAISRHGVTHSGGPNFAYDLCVRRVGAEQRAALDLSSWAVAYNGAEPVRRETLERFAEAFEPCGFRRRAFYPAYGLAEATLKVTGGIRDDEPVYLTVRAGALEGRRVLKAEAGEAGARALVGSGRAALGTEVVVVNPESSRRSAPDEVGEIWVAGPGVAKGYWNRPEETGRTFRARLSGGGEETFLRTGDLGFVRDGELFVTGRLKDLIIIRGRNLYPQDVEHTVERCHAALRPGGGAAFSVEVEGEERLVVAHEVEARRGVEASPVVEAIRGALAEEFEVQPAAVLLLRPGGLPKTSSGKVRRGACRERFLENGLRVLAEWRAGAGAAGQVPAPPAPDELGAESVGRWLRALLAAKLNVEAALIDVNQPLARYGVDSLLALELTHAVETGLGVRLPPADFLRSPTIAGLAGDALARLAEAARAPEAGHVSAADKVTADEVTADNAAEDEVTADEVTADEVTADEVTADEVGEHPLSHGQQALWFLQKVSPESTAYHLSLAARVRGEVDAAALRRAFHSLAGRHPMLRSTFPARLGAPVRLVGERAEISFRAESAAGWSEEFLRAALRAEASKSFDLERGPLLRVGLFERSPRDYALLLSAHHIVVDFWSLAVLMRELGQLYEAETGGGAAPPAPRAAPYADHVRRQARMLAGAEGERLREFWRRRLAGELPTLDLPADRARPAVQTYRGASHSVRLGARLTEGLRRLGASREATLFMTLLAAFQVLLHRYTGEEDVLIGSPTAGRGSAQFADTVGYFVNPLVLRASVSGGKTFAEFLDETRASALEAFGHQDYPFDLLVKELQPERDPARPPLFQVMFAFQKTRRPDEEGLAAFALGEDGARVRLGPLLLESLALEQRAAQFDLSLTTAETGDGLAASFEYNTDLFDAPTVERMGEHFRALLEGAVADPSARLSELPMLSATERRRLLVEWNDTREEFGGPALVHELFERQAARAPDRVAVSSGRGDRSYRELNERANRIAHHLRARGVGPDVVVAVCVGRSFEMVAALLGVLKAGGCYVPLDPAYPEERLRLMLEDSGATLLLTERRFAGGLEGRAARLVLLDDDAAGLAGESAADPPRAAAPENLAYVIYTSGSTGRPKGVMVTHGSLTNFVRAACAEYGVGPEDRVLQFASFSFDASAEEIFTSLASGATLVLRDGEAPAAPADFLRECRRKGLTVLDLPTAYWHELAAGVTAEEWAAVTRLRLVVIGGERALPERVARWRREVGARVRLVNTYGPTEATVVATTCDLTGDAEAQGATQAAPIGRPVRNAQAYILDGRLQPAPVGVRGELHLGGAGLARGYLGRPALTAERFVPHPFSAEPGARLYRTGDLARFLPDGRIEFLGRADEQVKVRGHRVEPGEIEAALRMHASVREAFAAAREEGAGQRRLVAYVVAARGRETTAGELRSFLKGQLPEHMIPSSFVLLEALPLLPNGKVNRRALPAPGGERAGADEPYAEPRNASERALCDIWAEVLGLGRVGRADNFFELGGDSILSIQVVGRARHAGLELSPSQIFEHPTPAELAAVARAAREAPEAREAAGGEAPLTPIQRWFFEQDFDAPHHWNMSLMLKARERLDPALLEKAFALVSERHDALRLRFACGPEGWRQFVAAPEVAGESGEATAGGESFVRHVSLAGLSEDERRAALERIAGETQAGLDLARGPLLRAALFDLGAGRPQRLLVVVHHLAVDGVSWRILLEDLARAYGQLRRGEAVNLPPKTTPFALWARRLEGHARAAESRAELEYWTALPAGRVKPLPRDRRGGRDTEAAVRTLTVALGADETRALLREVPEAYHTQINDVLLTALLQGFTRWTGERALLVELEGHGREEIFDDVDLSRTVGWFTSAFPVLLEAGEWPTPGEALKSVKEQLRRTPRRGVGYGLLRYMSGDAEAARAMRRLPEPEVSFNYLGQLDRMLEDSAPFEPAREPGGAARDGGARRARPLEVNAGVVEGRLKIDWVYGSEFYLRATVESLAQGFLEALRAVVAHCRGRDAGGHTPSDFPLARVDQRTLDELAREGGGLEDLYPLSPMQQGMLFHSVYAPDAGMYTGLLSFALRGGLDAEAFARAWRRAVERHAVLRSSFVWENLDEPLQAVRKGAAARLELHDWREWAADEQERRLDALLEEERRRGFDPAVAPLLRLKLLRLGAGSHRLVWTHHHLLLDGWSLSLLLREVFDDYEALRRGVDARPRPARPYRDYIAWLRRQDSTRAESFWRAYLAGFNAPTPLAVDRAPGGDAPAPGDGARAPDTRRLRVRLSAEATGRLRALGRERRLTLNTLTQGAWALLLSRYSRERDVLFGATVAGRPAELSGAGEMVGLFINTLPVRARVQPETPLLSWLGRLQAGQAAAREYEHSPLVEVQAWGETPRGAPLFESLLVFENYPVDVRALGSGAGLEVGDVRWFDQTNYPLTLVAVPGDELSLELLYDGRRFAGEAVGRMLGHLQTILEGFGADASRPLSHFPLVTPAERRRLLSEWNDTRREGGWRGRCVHQLFEEQARRTPGRVALVCGREEVTYGELNERANRLAHHLVALGVGPESRVCVCLERGVEMMVAVLAVLKAGGAYVPLDPSYPEERLAFMLEDSGARVLLTENRLLAGRGLGDGGARAVCVDAEREEIARRPSDDPAARVSGDNLIYVIYTSGSTGRPKGAGVTHGGFVNLVNWFVSEFGMSARDRVLIITSFSFDQTQKDLFAPLAVGGRLHLLRSAFYDAAEISETIAAQEINLLNCTPSAFYPLVDGAGPDALRRLSSLKHVFLGGETINVSRLRAWAASPHFGAEVVNTYGPTECTDTCSSFRLRDFEGPSPSSPPIGKPNDNAELLILDECLNLAPQGVAGELCVGGAGVGRGYLNNPSKTAERFVPHPFSAEPGARLYRTGDLARHLPDGEIEFLGRLDQQVKVRGHRVEPGEIEAAARRHEAVKECVVVARADAHGDARLVAYVVTGRGAWPAAAADLRRHLADRLPAHMLPSAFVALEALPLTPSGKVDRGRLPEPDAPGEEGGAGHVAPRDAVEEALAGVWREVLGLGRVGVHDNFFDLGGHSLVAMRCLSAMRRLFRVEIPLRVLFETATLGELARALKSYEDQPGKFERVARAWQRVKSLSPEELQNELRRKRVSRSGVKEDE